MLMFLQKTFIYFITAAVGEMSFFSNNSFFSVLLLSSRYLNDVYTLKALKATYLIGK